MATGATYIGGQTGNIGPVEVDGSSETLAEDLLEALVDLGLVVDTSA